MGLSKKDRAELRTKALNSLIEQHGVLDIVVENDTWSDKADALDVICAKANSSGLTLSLSVQSTPDAEFGMVTVFSLRPVADVQAFVKALKATWK